ncbi:MAG: methyltransferase domain-containing protein [Magnetococcales bacterium]|nr:methyltransferase domain-containing protein [Magnetococcales bacterium]
MNLDAIRLQNWYATVQGRAVARLVGGSLEQWMRPSVAGCTFGFGFVQPYMEYVISGREGSFGAAPAEMGVLPWPSGSANRVSLVRPNALPYPDGCFDRVFMIHLLEGTESPRETLREVWRVMKPGGRLFIVAPNRGGFWARRDTTPFGWGQPYSPRQIRELLEASFFVLRQAKFALFMPPLTGRRILRSASAWEKIGDRWFARFGGVILSDAEKVVHAVTPLLEKTYHIRQSSRIVLPLAGNRGTVNSRRREHD